MYKLSSNWLTEGLIDAEYKQYQLLAYLRDIHQVFEHKILYPPFAELIENHRYLTSIKTNLNNIEKSDKELKGIDWTNMKLIYGSKEKDEKHEQNKDELDIIKEIIEFSIPKIEKEIQHGKKIFDEVESHLTCSTVGITPLQKDIGYIFIQNYPAAEFSVFKYQISSIYAEIDHQNVPFKSLNTEYIATYSLSISKTLTSIKQEIIKLNPEIPNPSVYSFFPKTIASMEYTILPIVKRLLLRIAA